MFSFVTPLNKVMFGLVFFILAPKVGFLDISVLSLLISWFFWGRKKNVDVNILLLTGLFLAILIIVLMSCLINQNLNSDIILKPIRQILILFFLYPLLSRQEITLAKLIEVIVWAGVVNSLFVLMQVYADIVGISNDYLRFYPAGETEGALRKQGLSSGFPSSGVLSAISAVLAIIMFIDTRKYSYLILSVLCYPGVFMSARTAVVLFGISVVLVILLGFIKGKINEVLNLLLLISIVLIFAIIVIGENDRLLELFYVMFEFYYAFEESGSFGVRSTDDLINNHYFLPSNMVEWVFGNSRSAWGEEGIESDVWFIQTLIGSGLLSMILYLFAFSILFYFAFRYSRKTFRLATFVVFAFVLVSSFKASFVFSRFVGDVATLIGVFGFVLYRRSKSVHI